MKKIFSRNYNSNSMSNTNRDHAPLIGPDARFLEPKEFKAELEDGLFFSVVSFRDTTRKDKYGQPLRYTREIFACTAGTPSNITIKTEGHFGPEERYALIGDGEVVPPIAYVSPSLNQFRTWGLAECKGENAPIWVAMNADEFERRRREAKQTAAAAEKVAIAATAVTKASPFKKPAFRK